MTTPSVLDPALEPVADALIKAACRGGQAVLDTLDLKTFGDDTEEVKRYLRAVHRGFEEAQTQVLERLLVLDKVSSEKRSPQQRGEALLLRNIADAIAWQMINRELYVARRLYRGEEPPSLSAANWPPVLEAARAIAGETFDSFGLMSDLTSFVQTGDIFAMKTNEGGLTIIEVKEGAINERILSFLETASPNPDPQTLEGFKEREGDKTYEQLLRVLRQHSQMKGVKDTLNTDQGVDHTTGLPLSIRPAPATVEFYDNRLENLIRDSQEKGWALDVIDDCLFVGAYRLPMARGADAIFRAWFEGCGGTSELPIVSLLQSLGHPLALPPFVRTLSHESAMDVLFGRCVVLVGVHLDGFIELAKTNDMTLRWSTRKETGRFANKGLSPIRRGKSVLLADIPGGISCLQDGLFFRSLFHGLRPATLLEFLRDEPGPVPE